MEPAAKPDTIQPENQEQKKAIESEEAVKPVETVKLAMPEDLKKHQDEIMAKAHAVSNGSTLRTNRLAALINQPLT